MCIKQAEDITHHACLVAVREGVLVLVVDRDWREKAADESDLDRAAREGGATAPELFLEFKGDGRALADLREDDRFELMWRAALADLREELRLVMEGWVWSGARSRRQSASPSPSWGKRQRG